MFRSANITRIDENDGGFWEYGYDGRNRLVDAVYTTPAGHEAVYAYTYDDGDNMTQKVEPFQDDFNDENSTGWTTTGTWSANGGYAQNSVNTGGLSQFYLNRTEEDGELRFSYYSEDTSNNAYFLRALFRSNDDISKIEARFAPNGAQLMEYVIPSGFVTRDTESSATTTQGVWYDVLVKLNGANVSVWRAERGQELQEILSTTSSTTTATQYLTFAVPANAQFRLDDAKVIDGVTQSTWAMTSNDANELTQMSNTAQGTTIDYTYDAMGRTSEKAMGAKTALYEWAYGGMLAEVDTDFIGEADVSYGYGGDQKRRSRTSGATTTGYNWDSWSVIQEETGAGALASTYVHNPQRPARATLARVSGSNPATGTINLFLHDHLGSTRALYSASKVHQTSYDYSPIGDILNDDTSSFTTHRYSGHDWDPSARILFAPYRYLSPASGRWISRDPLGMVDTPNVYLYARGNSVNLLDVLGLCSWKGCREAAFDMYWGCIDRAKSLREQRLSETWSGYDALADAINDGYQSCTSQCGRDYPNSPWKRDTCREFCEWRQRGEITLARRLRDAGIGAAWALYGIRAAGCAATLGTQLDHCNRTCCNP